MPHSYLLWKILAGAVCCAEAFVLVPPRKYPHSAASKIAILKQWPRYPPLVSPILLPATVQDDDEDDRYAESDTLNDVASSTCYIALPPGTHVNVRVDAPPHLARKAWKKRRRAASPLLVPCSVLDVPYWQALQWNFIYLLQKFGSSSAQSQLRLGMSDLLRWSSSHLSLRVDEVATRSQLSSADELVEKVLDSKAQQHYGVRLERDSRGGLVALVATISQTKARQRAELAPLVQCHMDAVDDKLKHTGRVRLRLPQRDKHGQLYKTVPLSAALRIAQDDVDVLQQGSVHGAVVLDHDAEGDAGMPLLMLSMSSHGNIHEPLRMSKSSSTLTPQSAQGVHGADAFDYIVSNLTTGQGPLLGKVVQMVKGGALVDCGIGRKVLQDDDDNVVPILGLLRFTDATDRNPVRISSDEILSSWFNEIESDDNNDEDITEQFSIDVDGNLVQLDCNANGQSSLGSPDNNDGAMEIDNDRDLHDDSATPTPQHGPKKDGKTRWLRVGDTLDLYVKQYSKQSNRLLLTLDSAIQGKSARELKKQSQSLKKLERLYEQLGGNHRVEELRGLEMDGIIQATSQTGDWMYVQPTGHDKLPVGVASVVGDGNGVVTLERGDAVRIRIHGVDQARGQLALHVLRKLSP